MTAEYEAPLGSVRLASNAIDMELGLATSRAADNLLTKAIRRLADGDHDGARGFVERALKLPRDDHDDIDPAPWAAHMTLFNALVDDVEGSPEGDDAWLGRAEQVLREAAPVAAAEVRAVLRTMLASMAELTPAETRRLRALTPGVPEDAEPLDGVPDEPEARIAAILEVLAATLHHRRLSAATGS